MADMHINLHPVAAKLHVVADKIGNSIIAQELRKLADDLQHKLEAWHASVDDWIANPVPALDEVKKRAFAEYRALVTRANSILDGHKQ